MRISTSAARDQLSAIITRVQDPREFCVLTRHGRPVAAIVSMTELKRIWLDEEIEDISSGKHYPAKFIWGPTTKYATNAEAAAAIHKVQLDRKMEREVLARAGKAPVPGGEVVMEMEVAVPVERPRRRWWRFWRAAGARRPPVETAPGGKAKPEISDEVRAELSELVAHNFYRKE